MKYINIPIYLNRFIFGITALLYLTIVYGLYAQIVLGGFQLITAFILLFLLPKLTNKQKNNLLKYWLIVVAYGLLWFTGLFSASIEFWIGFIIIPLSIAIYFTVILESLKIQKR
ncbi:hypothetical protein RQM59_07630 [Flavobacteriaceae bacterium S356]|uniref:Uncharacterized protein n=1 Tax=Asprobacillus argus TaxID=3076534 RepID=A0ABU3LG35_9FLAO|nr:hypothetical protein [Flavobacteriaceae bacterium S356]